MVKSVIGGGWLLCALVVLGCLVIALLLLVAVDYFFDLIEQVLREDFDHE
jgi:hypothetical protein